MMGAKKCQKNEGNQKLQFFKQSDLAWNAPYIFFGNFFVKICSDEFWNFDVQLKICERIIISLNLEY